MSRLRALLADRRAASAAEFGLVLPLFILVLLGVIDAARFLYDYNQAEKATQMGARLAVVATPIPTNLINANFVGVGGLTPGDSIPVAAMGSIKCTDAACVCEPSGSTCIGAGAHNAAAFDAIFARTRAFKQDITQANLEVIYSGSGLGFAGDPSGMDPSPIVTVRLKNLPFRPTILLNMLSVNLPAFATSLTAEDLVGSNSN